jgi:hypothetical protein
VDKNLIDKDEYPKAAEVPGCRSRAVRDLTAQIREEFTAGLGLDR